MTGSEVEEREGGGVIGKVHKSGFELGMLVAPRHYDSKNFHFDHFALKKNNFKQCEYCNFLMRFVLAIWPF